MLARFLPQLSSLFIKSPNKITVCMMYGLVKPSALTFGVRVWCFLAFPPFFLRKKFRNLLFLPLSAKRSFLNHLRNSFILVKCFLKSDDTRLTLWLFYVMWMDKGNKLDNVVWNAFFIYAALSELKNPTL